MSSIDPFDDYRSGGLGPQPVVGTGDRPVSPAPTVPSDFVFCPDHDAIFIAFMQLLPTGAAWDNMELSYERSSVIRQFMSGVALSWMHFEDSMCVALDEWFCQSSTTDLDLWMRDYGVPDECELYNQSLCAKVQANGPATAEYLLGLMQSSGYEATGRWLKGDDIQFPGVHSTFYVLIDTTISPAFQLQPALRFQLGMHHTLGDVDIENIQCMLERYIPAHCVAIVGTAGEFEPESLGVKLRYWWSGEDAVDGPVNSWADRIGPLVATLAGNAPVSALDPAGRRYVAFSKHNSTALRTPSVTVSGGPGGSGDGITCYIALWTQQEALPRPADWLLGELNGLTIDFTYDGVAKIVVKTSGVNTEWTVDDFLVNSATSPKLIWDADSRLVWTTHNMALQSQAFDQTTPWNPSTAVTVAANATAAPDGTMTADKLMEVANTTNHQLIHANITQILGETYTFSVYAKKAERTWLCIESGNANATNFFDLANGVMGAHALPATMEAVGEGWYRCAVTYVNAGAGGPVIFMRNTPVVGVYAGDATKGVYVWGAQLHRGATLLPYLSTTTAARYTCALDHDPLTHAGRGLLAETQITNLILQSSKLDDATWSKSNLTVVANAEIAPTGIMEADKIVETTTPSVQHLAGRTTNMTVVSATQYCFSAFLKPAGRTWVMLWDNQAANSGVWFNLAGAGTVGTRQAANQRASITQLPNGWYRCEMTYTTTTTVAQAYIALCQSDNTSSYTGDGVSGVYVWNAQYEVNNYASSPVPTYTVTVVRAQDTYTCLTSQLPWSNTEATVYSESIARDGAAAAAYVWDIYQSATARAVGQYASGNMRLANVTTSTDAAVQSGPPVVQGARQKFTAAMKTNDYAASTNGNAIGTDAAVAFASAATKMGFGCYSNNGFQLNGWLEKLTWVPRRVVNADLPTWRYNYVPPDTRVIASRGTGSNYRRFGTRHHIDHEAFSVSSSPTDILVDTNPGTTLTGPIVGAAGFDVNELIGRVFGTYTTPPTLPAMGTQAATTSPITLGANVATPPGENFDGNLYHLMVAVDLTASEYLQLEAWLAWHIDRPDILDGSHPYRNIRP